MELSIVSANTVLHCPTHDSYFGSPLSWAPFIFRRCCIYPAGKLLMFLNIIECNRVMVYQIMSWKDRWFLMLCHYNHSIICINAHDCVHKSMVVSISKLCLMWLPNLPNLPNHATDAAALRCAAWHGCRANWKRPWSKPVAKRKPKTWGSPARRWKGSKRKLFYIAVDSPKSW